MPKISEKDRVQADHRQAQRANDTYRDWNTEYECDLLEDYYYGKQWQGEADKRKYVINLFYPSINISKPSMLFQMPKYKVTPRPTRMDDAASDVEARAKLQEETLNSVVQDPTFGFIGETGLAVLDGQFRFGVVQVGYTADIIDNPDAGKPMLRDGLPILDDEAVPVPQANVKIQSESAFLKWIPAKQFRVSANSHNKTSACDWVGYYEWHYADDLKANPRYNGAAKKELKPTGRLKGEKDTGNPDDDHKPGMVKVWFKWDIRSKERRIWAEGGEKYLLTEKYKFLPLAGLKFDEVLGQWLPMPLAYNWIHPQNQLNDIREMRRQHRKRALPKFLRRRNAFMDEEEFDKLCESEEGGTAIVEGDTATAILPVPYPALDPSIFRDEQSTLEDFTRVSGISGESQQVAQSETATQANLIALMGQTRESAKRVVVGEWLSQLGRIILLTLREHMALPFWIKRNVDPASPMAQQEAQEVALLWKQIQAEDLGDIDMDISVDLASMSPVQQAQERTDWMTFLGVVTNPALGIVLSGSPALLRKTAGLFNITSERDLQEVAQALEKAAMMFVAAQAQKAGVESGPQAGIAAPGPTPTNPEIAGQIGQQLPTETVQ